MTTITDAHRAEARRRLNRVRNWDAGIAELIARALAEPAWQPPVDPDLIEARECAALVYTAAKDLIAANMMRLGEKDDCWAVQSALIAIKRRQA